LGVGLLGGCAKDEHTVTETKLVSDALTYPIGARLALNSAEIAPFIGEGWFGPETNHRWTSEHALFHFKLEQPQAQALMLRMAAPACQHGTVEFELNGERAATLEPPTGNPDVIEIKLPPHILKTENILRITVPGAASPVSLGRGEDPRNVGLMVLWIELRVDD